MAYSRSRSRERVAVALNVLPCGLGERLRADERQKAGRRSEDVAQGVLRQNVIRFQNASPGSHVT
mgnify:CR=1 FL=1